MRHLIIFILGLLISGPVLADSQRVLVQSTTSTQNSGLYDYLLPIFEAETGIDVDVVAVGTGQAIRNAENGDADVLLVHAKASEEAFVAAGYGVERFDLMYNDFVFVGPASDPSGLKTALNVGGVLAALQTGNAPFVSRGDDSGTHKVELRFWDAVGSIPAAAWYREAGAGMGATLRLAIEMNGYTLTDRATWIAYGAKADHRIVFEGDDDLFNQYGVIVVNAERHKHVNEAGANRFSEWLRGEEGQSLIAAYQRDGQQLFFPNAR